MTSTCDTLVSARNSSVSVLRLTCHRDVIVTRSISRGGCGARERISHRCHRIDRELNGAGTRVMLRPTSARTTCSCTHDPGRFL